MLKTEENALFSPSDNEYVCGAGFGLSCQHEGSRRERNLSGCYSFERKAAVFVSWSIAYEKNNIESRGQGRGKHCSLYIPRRIPVLLFPFCFYSSYSQGATPRGQYVLLVIQHYMTQGTAEEL